MNVRRLVRAVLSISVGTVPFAAVQLAAVLLAISVPTQGAEKPPVLTTLFPPGGQAGQSFNLAVEGTQSKIRELRSNVPGFRAERTEPDRFRISIPQETVPGCYDIWAVNEQGISSPRTFLVGNLTESLETEPNNDFRSPNGASLATVMNGRIGEPGDADHFGFSAKKGQRIIVECWAERIDSRLRAILEIVDQQGRRLATSRGYFGIDPLIDFRAPAEGSYFVRIYDLISGGSSEHYYRLDIDAGPRVLFTIPTVIERGKSSTVRVFGWNLIEHADSLAATPRYSASRSQDEPDISDAKLDGTSSPSDRRSQVSEQRLAAQPLAEPRFAEHRLGELDSVEIVIPASTAQEEWPLPVGLSPAQASLSGFAYYFPGSHAAHFIGVTDVPVIADPGSNRSPSTALEIDIPAEVSGQLVSGDERGWFSIQARRGEVVYIEAFAQRIRSPMDVQVSIVDAATRQELVQFGDSLRGQDEILPLDHLDPAGRWVVPRDGRYLICVRNLQGGLSTDPRRVYQLSVRREEPDFDIVVAPRSEEPIGINIERGGRAALELMAIRRGGFEGEIRVSVENLPAGLACSDVWLGPGVERTSMVVSADPGAVAMPGNLELRATATGVGSRHVKPGTVVRTGLPRRWGRLTSQIPVSVVESAPIKVTADAHETLNHHLYGKLQVRHAPGGVLDVVVDIERQDNNHQAPVKLMGVGLPDSIRQQTAVISSGQSRGYLSFYLPPNLQTGHYSLAVRAETTVPATDPKTKSVVVYSNTVDVVVQPAAFLVEVDPFAPKQARRGETIQVAYTSLRRNGFIGKMHTEIASPGRITDVVGLRGRGETFVGQTDKGSLQIIVNEDAPLGPQPFLRLFTVGVVEDEPIYHGASFFTLEVVE